MAPALVVRLKMHRWAESGPLCVAGTEACTLSSVDQLREASAAKMSKRSCPLRTALLIQNALAVLDNNPRYCAQEQFDDKLMAAADSPLTFDEDLDACDAVTALSMRRHRLDSSEEDEASSSSSSSDDDHCESPRRRNRRRLHASPSASSVQDENARPDLDAAAGPHWCVMNTVPDVNDSDCHEHDDDDDLFRDFACSLEGPARYRNGRGRRLRRCRSSTVDDASVSVSVSDDEVHSQPCPKEVRGLLEDASVDLDFCEEGKLSISADRHGLEADADMDAADQLADEDKDQVPTSPTSTHVMVSGLVAPPCSPSDDVDDCLATVYLNAAAATPNAAAAMAATATKRKRGGCDQEDSMDQEVEDEDELEVQRGVSVACSNNSPSPRVLLSPVIKRARTPPCGLQQQRDLMPSDTDSIPSSPLPIF